MRSALPWSRLLCGLVLTAALAAQSATDMLVADYHKRHEEELIAAGQRHVDLGWSIRRSGLEQQATYQFVRAVELSEGKHQGAQMVLGIVRNYGEAFWRKSRKTPSKSSLLSYGKRAAAIERDDLAGQVRLAKMAQKAHLDDRMREHWLAALRLGAEIEIDKGKAKIAGEVVPVEFAEWLAGQTVEVDGGKPRFEPAGAAAPRVAGVHEVADERLVVRTDLPVGKAEQLHALGLALLPLLQDRLDGAPVRRLGLFVFGKRADYEQYLKACGHADALGGSGLCDYGTFQTLVSAEGLADEDLHALVLHELSHLFFFGASPVAMPDWYAEGFAESFGGQGTFTWDGKKLTAGGAMRRDRIDAVKQAPIPLRELLAGDAAKLLATEHEKGLRFYAQSWALQRFLLEKGNRWQDGFLVWEAQCRGSLPGAASTAKLGDSQPAAQAFERAFGKELDALETAFVAWLAGQ
ncbi:MAG TPA: hypothetical protein VFZ65_13630 [Planctomycetota bacterium]|nr:hypothetical protein [Planctomycetota bacterium]